MEQRVGDINKSEVENVNTYSAYNAKYKDRNVTALSSIAIIISILSISVSVIFGSSANRDTASILVGTLTILVTVLLGWNIYTTINIQNIIRREINKGIDNAKRSAMFVSIAQMGISNLNSNNTANAFQLLFNALSVWDADLDTELEKETFDYCVETLKKCALDAKRTEKRFVLSNRMDKDVCVKAAIKTQVSELIELAYSIEVNEDKS